MLPKLAHSADAQDGEFVLGDPRIDISDFYTWVDGDRVVYVLNVFSGVPKTSTFSSKAQYVVHTTSYASYGTTTGKDYNLITTFDADGNLSFWAGTDEYVTGDPTSETGLVSSDGRVKIYAGQRQDPFFCNLKGVNALTATLAKSTPTLDPAGCPQLDAPTASALATQLRTVPIPNGFFADGGFADGGVNDAGTFVDGGPIDSFGTANVLAIVISIDKKLVTQGGPVIAAWASTNEVPQ